ncbi:MAG: ATP-binding protein [Flavobacteriales bacterium]|nr:ATP-binding protein [Flavobacteriales bacterium]
MTTHETEKAITFSSTTDNISIVEKLIDDVCEQHKIKEDFYGNILIALTEAVNNAIVHGNKLDEDKNVHLSITAEEPVLRFRIEDEGPGFDYENLPDPTAPENIEKPNGRGVFLMRNLADRCEFFEDGKIVELEFDAIGL